MPTEARLVVVYDTATSWSTRNPTPERGQLCVETDTRRSKLGDGVNPWSDLGYFGEAFAAAPTLAQTFAAALSSWWIVGKSSVQVTCPANTTEDVLASVAIPGGQIGPNGAVRAMALWGNNNNANSKTGRIRYHTSAAVGGTILQAQAATTTLYFQLLAEFGNQNSQSSQRYRAGVTYVGVGGSATATMAIDSGNTSYIVFTGQKAVSGDTLTLDRYLVEILYGA